MKVRQVLWMLTVAFITSMELEAAEPEIQYGPIFNPNNGHTYYLLTPSTWTEAQAKAVIMGGNLVTINDQAEDEWVFNTFKDAAGNSHIWLGLNDAEFEGTFVWVSGEPVTYTNWKPGEPSNSSDEDYVEMYCYQYPNKWNDLREDYYWTVYGLVEISVLVDPATYHVDGTNGSDENYGFTRESAFATIQKAVGAAKDGDTILVWPGVYEGEVNFLGKAITVCSAADPAIIQAAGDFAVSMYSNEEADSVLKHFILRCSDFGIFLADSSPTLSHLTIVENMYGVAAYGTSDPDMNNCIFWNNSILDVYGCQAQYSYVDAVADPLFADPMNGDYHLRSEFGRYYPPLGLWVLDTMTSPCIDAGDPAADPAKEPKYGGGRVDLGAYGGTSYASMSQWQLPGDINYDGSVDLLDISLLVQNWLNTLAWVE